MPRGVAVVAGRPPRAGLPLPSSVEAAFTSAPRSATARARPSATSARPAAAPDRRPQHLRVHREPERDGPVDGPDRAQHVDRRLEAAVEATQARRQHDRVEARCDDRPRRREREVGFGRLGDDRLEQRAGGRQPFRECPRCVRWHRRIVGADGLPWRRAPPSPSRPGTPAGHDARRAGQRVWLERRPERGSLRGRLAGGLRRTHADRIAALRGRVLGRGRSRAERHGPAARDRRRRHAQRAAVRAARVGGARWRRIARRLRRSTGLRHRRLPREGTAGQLGLRVERARVELPPDRTSARGVELDAAHRR